MKNLFEIGIAVNDKTGTYAALVRSVTDNKVAVIENSSIRTVLVKLNKLIRDKTREVKNFPIPEPRRIISIAESRSSALVGPNGQKLNGRH